MSVMELKLPKRTPRTLNDFILIKQRSIATQQRKVKWNLTSTCFYYCILYLIDYVLIIIKSQETLFHYIKYSIESHSNLNIGWF